MKKLSIQSLLTRGLNAAIIIALGALALCVLIQVVMRYVLASPPFWTEELARFLLIWITFIGAVSVQNTRGHIGVTWLEEQLPPRARAFLEVIKSMVVLIVLLFIVKAGFDIARTGTQVSPALGLSMRFVYGTLPAGAALTVIIVLLQLWDEVRVIITGKEVHNGG
jgi:TRAP-type C4-dicarboxylate transport system permease small subunit